MTLEIKKLGDVCEKGSSNISINKIDDDNGKYPIYGAKGIIKNVSFYHQDKEYISIIKDGAGIGRIEFREPFSSVIGTLQYIIPKPNINIKYLYYFLLGIDFSKYSQGAAIPHIYFKDYSKEELVIPSLQEQKRIVAILDKAFEKISKAKENAENNLQNAKEIFESYLQNVFENKGEGWEEKTLGEICEYDKTPNEKDLPYVGLEHIESNTGKFLGLLTPQKVKSLTFNFTDKHVLYGRLRPYLNKVLLPNFEGHCSTEIFPIIVKKPLDRKYLFYWLITAKTVKKINATWTGARMPRANMNEVLNFKINLPSISTQKELILKLDKLKINISKLTEIYEKKLEHLEELKRSILQKAFKGELTQVSI